MQYKDNIDWQLNIDGEIYNRPHKSIVYALNKLLDSNTTPSSIDEYSMLVNECTNGIIIGVIPTRDSIVLFSLPVLNNQFRFEIGRFKDNVYNIILRTEYIDFSSFDAIRGVCDYNIKGETIIAWCNGIKDSSTKPCILNLDDLPFKSGINPTTYELINPDEINMLYMFPEMTSIPQITDAEVFDGGGNLISGVYYIAFAYGVNKYDIGNYVYVSNPISIYRANKSLPYQEIVGCGINENTSKAINVKIEDIDINFKYLSVAIIHKSNENFNCYIFNDNISSDSKYFLIDSLSRFEKVDISLVTENAIIYEKIHAITKIDRRCIIGRVKVRENVDYQKFANNIKVQYVDDDRKEYYGTSGINFENTYKHSYNIVFEKTFLPNEVYALYIRLRFTDGSLSEAFHIPGRKRRDEIVPSGLDRYMVYSGIVGGHPVIKSYYEDAVITNGVDSLSELNPNSSPVVNHFNNDILIAPDIKIFHTRDTSFIYGGIKYLGYWDNLDELYPDDDNYDVYDVDINGIGISTGYTLRNKRVRHHKMPSVDKLFNRNSTLGYYNHTDSNVGSLYLRLYDIKFPKYIEDKIIGFEILYAKRNFANSIIQASLSMTHWLYQYYDIAASKPVSNKYIPIDYRRQDFNFTNVKSVRNLNNIVLFPYDLMKTGGQLLFNYISCQLKVSYQNDWANNYYGVKVEKYTGGEYEDANSYIRTLGLHKGGGIGSGVSTVVESEKIRNVKDSKYINNSFISDSVLDNEYGQSCVLINIDNPDTYLTIPDLMTVQPTMNKYLVDLCMFKRNCYYEYNNQELISCGVFYNKSLVDINLTSGDCFIGLHSYRVTGLSRKCIYSDENAIFRLLYSYPIYSVNNIELRYEGDGIYSPAPPYVSEDKERIFPKLGGDCNIPYGSLLSAPFSIFTYKNTKIDNFYGIGNRGYNLDYTSLNDIFKSVIFNIFNPRVDIFPNRVHASIPNQSESLGLGWRKFLYDGYREMPSDKGAITLLEATDDILYIQCEKGLFIDNPKDTLETIDASIGLQETTILARKPKEVLYDKDGEIGCVNMFGAIITKYGYCVIDSVKGRLYILRDNIQESTMDSVTSYLKLYGSLPAEEVNIFNDGGLMLAYDDKYERLLICKKSFNRGGEYGVDKSFTLSYHLFRKHFICFHSYIPDYIFGYNFKLYSIKNDTFNYEVPIPQIGHNFGILYEHNIETSVCTFYRETLDNITWEQKVYKSIIDVMYHSFYQSVGDRIMLIGHRYSKILNSLSWITSTYDFDGNMLYDETVDKIAVYNDSQCTGELFVKNSYDWFNNKCGRNVDDTWFYNDLKDFVLNNKLKFIQDFEFIIANINKNKKNWYQCSYIVGKYIVARLISEQPDRLVKIHDIYIDFEANKR